MSIGKDYLNSTTDSTRMEEEIFEVVEEQSTTNATGLLPEDFFKNEACKCIGSNT